MFRGGYPASTDSARGSAIVGTVGDTLRESLGGFNLMSVVSHLNECISPDTHQGINL